MNAQTARGLQRIMVASVPKMDTSQRGWSIVDFRTGVNNGMHAVSFFNNGASMYMGSGKDNNLLASSSFQLASCTASERSNFCNNLLLELKGELNKLRNALQDNAKNSVDYADAAKYSGQTAVDKDDKEASAKQAFEAEVYSELAKEVKSLAASQRSLEEFNSDAAIRFKTLKEAANNKELVAKKQYYSYNNSLFNQTVKTGGVNFTDNNNSGKMQVIISVLMVMKTCRDL